MHRVVRGQEIILNMSDCSKTLPLLGFHNARISESETKLVIKKVYLHIDKSNLFHYKLSLIQLKLNLANRMGWGSV